MRQLCLFSLILTGLLTGPYSSRAQVSGDPNQTQSGVLIRPSLFGLSANSGIVSQQPWPEDSFGSLRLLGAGTAWSDMNPGPGKYDFDILTGFLQGAKDHGQTILLVFEQTPKWASSRPNDTSCTGPAGSCDPPNDLNADGTGSNQHWKDFVTAVVNLSVSFGPGHIRHYELWNEPYHEWYWTGTYAQLIRMAADAYTIIKSIDPTAKVASPSFAWEIKTGVDWMGGYFDAGGGQYADQIDVHGYVFNRNAATGWPENVAKYATDFHNSLRQYGQQGKPVWNSEANWGKDIPGRRYFDDPDLQAAWLARMYLMLPSYGVNYFYWFSWNDPGVAPLWEPDPNDPSQPGTLLKPGVAYQQVYNWMVGATLTQACTPQGTVWSCVFQRSGGYVAEAIWDASLSCDHGQCKTENHTVNAMFKQYRKLNGDTAKIVGNTVPVGAKPIWLENQ